MKLHALLAALATGMLLSGTADSSTLRTLDEAAPIVIAHRGAAGYLPEHTLGGYELAIQMGADYIEPDLFLTSDGVLIAMHDSTLIRTTNVREVFPDRSSYLPGDFTLAEIKQLTVVPSRGQAAETYPGFTPSMPDPYKVPTFKEVLDFLTEYNDRTGSNIGIYPEAKSPTSDSQTRQIVEQLNEAGFRTANDKVFIQSFDFDALKALAGIQSELGSDQLLVALGGASLLDDVYRVGNTPLSEIATFANGIGVSLGGASGVVAITQGFVDAAHALGLIVHGYTLRPLTQEESDAQIAVLFPLGYDGWFTDYTDRTRASVDALLPAEQPVAPVPLPAAGWLLISALGGLLLYRRKA